MTAVERDALPRLGRDAIAAGLTSGRVALPSAALLDLPVRAVQFGTGAFLRGFVDHFIDAANRQGAFAGRVVAIGSTASGRDVALNDQDGLYTLVVQGGGPNGPIREPRAIASVSRALSAQRDWGEVLSLARSAALEFVFSNTTEVGIAIDDGDRLDADPPPSFPGKLTRFLFERARAFRYADESGVIVIPCELIERNGDRLRDLVLALARRWSIEPEFARWIERAVPFCNTLVDRIVPGKPDDATRSALEREFGFRDEMMIAAEPYRLFAIEAERAVRDRIGFASADDGVVLTDDVAPYRERKVRILNGGHTLLASVGLLVGCETVLDAMRDELLSRYLRRMLDVEIVPSLDAPNGAEFANDVLLRFANPFLRHALTDITLQHTAKVRVRVVPSILRFTERTGQVPDALAFGFAAYLLLERQAAGTKGLRLGVDGESEAIRALWRETTDDSETALRVLVARACSAADVWGTDLSRLPGFAERVLTHIHRMIQAGVAAALEMHLERAAPALASSSSNATGP